jgi:hypothetical protein
VNTNAFKKMVAVTSSYLLVTPAYAGNIMFSEANAGGGAFGGGLKQASLKYRGGFGGGFGGGRSFGGFGGGGRSFGGFGGGSRDFGGGARGGSFGEGGFGGHAQQRDFGGGFGSVTGSRGFGDSGFSGGNRGGWNHGVDNGFGNRGGFPNENHPNYGFGNGHLPDQGGFGGVSGMQHRNTNPINQNNLDHQGNNIRNSFDNDNFNHNNVNQFNNYNVNAFGGAGYYHGGAGYYHGGWGYYHGWGYPGGWCCPGWASATAWTCMGLSTLTAFLGIGAMMSSGHGSSSTTTTVPVSTTNITYEGDNVYVNGQPAGSATQYYQQAQQLAQVGQSNPGDQNEEWQALGVFALAEPGQSDSNMTVQLAVNKAGTVRGNYFNQLTNESAQVYGAVDKNTQRVSWTIGTNPNTVFDAGLSDLTKENAQVLVHYGPNSTEHMALIRLNQPPEPKNGGEPRSS